MRPRFIEVTGVLDDLERTVLIQPQHIAVILPQGEHPKAKATIVFAPQNAERVEVVHTADEILTLIRDAYED